MTEFLVDSSWWVPVYGVLGAVVTLPWSTGLIRRAGSRPAAYLNIVMTVVALLHCVILWTDLWDLPALHVDIPWLKLFDLNLYFSIELSRVSLGAAVLITVLSLLAQFFALGYLEKDWALGRFYALMGFFEGAMTGIALSDSLFSSYALLEMLTLSTYLLVGFWYAQPLVVTAARDAFLTKRVGDLLMLMGVVALSAIAGTLDYAELTAWAETAELAPLTATLLGLALLAGPIGKCAQFPLNLWLDEAMEGPSPASILRNSVVVACGAYVLIRMQPILSLSPVVLTTLMVVGAITAIGASLVSIGQIDIKRALSHTTSAYLGLVFLAVGMQQDEVALMLLFAHALSKALLYMSVGSVTLTTSTQDLTEMGGLGSRMPATSLAFAIGSIAMVGMVPFGGFWAMQIWAERVTVGAPGLLLILLLVNGLTAFNLTRVFGLVFAGEPQAKTRRAPEAPWAICLPMVSLIVMCLLVPVMLLQWELLPSLASVRSPLSLAIIGSSVVGFGFGAFIYLNPAFEHPLGLGWKSMQDILAQDFRTDQLYRVTVVFAVRRGARLAAWFDRYVVDGMVNLIGVASIFGSESLKYTISGQSKHYLLTVVIGVILGIASLGWLF
ncbi:MAG: NAD(P)H-quinone oxidoreductase subunit F [Kaiparowitsia implicata GSE-PSE-MK54-09C]|jgi:NAD(P)H-quinone oxidoreductase subunit 5|nr:NAD(P)H-quinone oxidoreductase subunit F [Kaiparowitsia implicata GSE-PSE-MK54-09C]